VDPRALGAAGDALLAWELGAADGRHEAVGEGPNPCQGPSGASKSHMQ